MPAASRSVKTDPTPMLARIGMAAPSQERSRKSLDRMLVALEALLSERTFDKVTVADLARRADVSVGSIYARFVDKQALLIGMHRRIHERASPARQRLIDPERLRERSIDSFARGALVVAIRYYRQHGDVLRAVTISGSPEVFLMVRGEVDDFNAGLTDLIAAKTGMQDRAHLREAVDSTVHTVIAVLNQRIVQSTAPRSERSNRRLLKDLMTITRAFLAQAMNDCAASPSFPANQ